MTGKPFKRKLIPRPSAANWQRLVNGARDCLVDPRRPSLDLENAALKCRDEVHWPVRGNDGDDFLLGAFLRLCIVWNRANPARREWLKPVLATLHDAVEGMVDDATPDSEPKPAPLPAVAPPADETPARRFRADIDG